MILKNMIKKDIIEKISKNIKRLSEIKIIGYILKYKLYI